MRAVDVAGPKRTVIVAAVQAEVAPDLPRGLELTRTLAARAARDGAELVVFPETWLPGYPAWLDVCRDAALWDHPPVKRAFRRMAEESLTVPGAAADALADIARDNGITLVTGATERVDAGRGRGTLYNTLLVFGPDGRVLNHHRKLVPTYTERLVWGPGDARGVRVVDTPAGRIGGLICWEHWMPLARQALHEDGEDIHIALWPTVKEMSVIACRHYAFEGRCFVIAAGSLLRASALPAELEPHAALVSGPDQWVLRGGSCIIAPDGGVLAGPVYDEERIMLAELDLDRVREEAMALDVSGHYSRPDSFLLQRVGGREKTGNVGGGAGEGVGEDTAGALRAAGDGSE
jgi:predicted amidohydrolase